ncbi:hypothetical protein ABKN59_009569 [Abortiporus biennis]
MVELAEFPNEILLDIFVNLDLTALIHTRGVCCLWRNLVQVAKIPRVRRRLLQFYFKAVNSAAFLDTRKYILPNIRNIDRSTFVARLPASSPEELRCWLLEWPEKAIVGWIWPGLPVEPPKGIPSDVSLHACGSNFMGLTHFPRISTLLFYNPNSSRPQEDENSYHIISWNTSWWQSVDVETVRVDLLSICSFNPAPLLGTVVTEKLSGEMQTIASSWTDFLELELAREEWDLSGQGIYAASEVFNLWPIR